MSPADFRARAVADGGDRRTVTSMLPHPADQAEVADKPSRHCNWKVRAAMAAAYPMRSPRRSRRPRSTAARPRATEFPPSLSIVMASYHCFARRQRGSENRNPTRAEGSGSPLLDAWLIDTRRAGNADAANDVLADLDRQTARNCNNAGQCHLLSDHQIVVGEALGLGRG